MAYTKRGFKPLTLQHSHDHLDAPHVVKKWCTSWYAVICCRPKNGSLHWHLCIPSYYDILWITTGLLEADKAKTERNQIKPATGLTSRWMIPTPQTEWIWANASFQVNIDMGAGVTSWYRLGHPSHHPIQDGSGKLRWLQFSTKHLPKVQPLLLPQNCEKNGYPKIAP